MSVENSTNTDFYHLSVAIKENSPKILERLYADNYPGIEKYIMRNTGSQAEAKDIFQEAFVVVWRNVQLGRFVPQNENEFAAYLFRVSKNKWISHLRSTGHKKTSVLPDDTGETANETIAEEEQGYLNAVAEGLKQLGENCKELLTMFYYKKQSLRDIAGKFGWTEATARNNKYRCIEKLRNLLKNKK